MIPASVSGAEIPVRDTWKPDQPAEMQRPACDNILTIMVGFMRYFRDLNIIKSASMALLFLFAVPVSGAQTVFAQQVVQFSSEPLKIETAKGGTHDFTVELAVSEPQLRYGLMFRRSMPADHGMLFVFDTTRRIMMWMEDTALPLDMLFLDDRGRITHIKQNAVPYSRDVIDSQYPVRYVVELNAGIAQQLGLAVGDKVLSASIAQKAAGFGNAVGLLRMTATGNDRH